MIILYIFYCNIDINISVVYIMFLCQKYEKDSKIYFMNLLLSNFINISCINIIIRAKISYFIVLDRSGVDDERGLQFRLKICEPE